LLASEKHCTCHNLRIIPASKLAGNLGLKKMASSGDP
jgi:hypothetical protein